MKLSFDLIASVRRTALGSILAKMWHRSAPSVRVRRKVFGLTMYFDFRDNAVWWARSADKIEREEAVFDFLTSFKGTVWDVGSNVGIVSLRAASLGHRVIAFDISRKALGLLEASARANGLNITTVPRAFSTRSFSYDSPSSSDTENAIRESAAGKERSITFLEAAKQYPVPDLLKMDIEGGENDFIGSEEFKQWILKNNIAWVVEFHAPDFRTKLWKDCKFVQVDSGHFALNLDRIAPMQDSAKV
jgi:FkbM family methyltransferase